MAILGRVNALEQSLEEVNRRIDGLGTMATERLDLLEEIVGVRGVGIGGAGKAQATPPEAPFCCPSCHWTGEHDDLDSGEFCPECGEAAEPPPLHPGCASVVVSGLVPREDAVAQRLDRIEDLLRRVVPAVLGSTEAPMIPRPLKPARRTVRKTPGRRKAPGRGTISGR